MGRALGGSRTGILMAHKRSPKRIQARATGARPATSLSPRERAQLATQAPAARAATRTPAAPTLTAAPQSGPSWLARVIAAYLRKHWLSTGTVVVLAAIAIFAVVRGLQTNASSAVGQVTNGNPTAAGKVAPNFTLTAEQGGTYSLSQYRGKVVVLELFAPWCPHCQAEVDTLNSIARASSDQVQVLSVSASPYGFNYESMGDTSPIKMADLQKFVTQFHVIYPALLDTSLRTANAYGVYGYPAIYVIDRNGVITWNNGQGGETSYTDLQTQINKALAVPLKPATPTTSAGTTPTVATATPKK
jgi:peroxiredoxin